MTVEHAPEFIIRLLRLFQFDYCGEVWWRGEPELDGPLSFFVTCNDAFWWATGDNERITPENIGVLEQAFADLEKVRARSHAPLLFCARVRGMRPQGAMYKYIPDAAWPLFDAAGPARDQKEPGNTPRPEKSGIRLEPQGT